MTQPPQPDATGLADLGELVLRPPMAAMSTRSHACWSGSTARACGGGWASAGAGDGRRRSPPLGRQRGAAALAGYALASPHGAADAYRSRLTEHLTRTMCKPRWASGGRHRRRAACAGARLPGRRCRRLRAPAGRRLPGVAHRRGARDARVRDGRRPCPRQLTRAPAPRRPRAPALSGQPHSPILERIENAAADRETGGQSRRAAAAPEPSS